MVDWSKDEVSIDPIKRSCGCFRYCSGSVGVVFFGFLGELAPDVAITRWSVRFLSSIVALSRELERWVGYDFAIRSIFCGRARASSRVLSRRYE